MKKSIYKIITAAIIISVLVLVFWWGGNAPGLSGWNVENQSLPSSAPIQTSTPIPQTEAPNETITPSPALAKETSAPILASKPIEPDSIPTSLPQAPTPEPAKDVPTCTLSVKCDIIFNNMERLASGKASVLPSDGIIFPEQEVSITEGESVFDLLLREMKKNNIHLEFVNTPIYNSTYIEGIANLYEFDCGELSGWMYRVNGWFPNYGCSSYFLKDGDRVEWIYTCESGADIGGAKATGQFGF